MEEETKEKIIEKDAFGKYLIEKRNLRERLNGKIVEKLNGETTGTLSNQNLKEYY